MRNEKGLNRYREEQNLNESDLNLFGFVCLVLSFAPHHPFSLGYFTLCKYVCKMRYEYRSNQSIQFHSEKQSITCA